MNNTFTSIPVDPKGNEYICSAPYGSISHPSDLTNEFSKISSGSCEEMKKLAETSRISQFPPKR